MDTKPQNLASQASSASQDAAADWQEFIATDGRRYYYNNKTKQSSWEKPFEMMTLLERADASTVWKEFTTAEGKTYYYNKDTKQSKWSIPDELKLARKQAEKEASRETHSPATLTSSTLDQLSASVSSTNDVSSPVGVTPIIPVANEVAESSSGCAARGLKRKRGACKNLNLEKALENNDGDPLLISFDIDDQRTYGPVGKNASMFKSLVGAWVRYVPLYHDSWEKVPADKKDHLWPTIERYFDMKPYLDRLENDPVRKGVINGVHAYCAERYRGAKYHFKNKWFTKRGGPEAVQEIRAQPPPHMDIEEWGRLVNCYMSEGALHRSEVNSGNRALQQYIGTHGRKSFAEIRHDVRQRTGEYPTLISTFGDTHMRDGAYVDMLAQQQHEQMQQLWDSQQSSPNPMTEEEIMEQVLGTRGGHHRGRGRIVRGSSLETSAGSQVKGETSAGLQGKGETSDGSQGKGVTTAGSQGKDETSDGSQGKGVTTAGSQGKGGRWFSQEEVEQREARLRSELLKQMEAQMEARLQAQIKEQMQTMFDQHMRSQGFHVQQPVPQPTSNPH
uniref:uncharacterized protein LOC122607418 isoform X2 n=1 Tax=Erigeron canadensis TaxID=72917 RepID=UPI001CB8CA8A|nr:uncharacterized protein LOC122607418 isoform X2 [Erigeron canadensis]